VKKPEDAFGLGDVSRREFGLRIASLGIAGVLEKATPDLAQSPGEEKGPQHGSSGPDCDLLIMGGTVIDPSQNLHAKLDVAVREGKILEVSRDFPEDRAVNVLSAKDKIVTPGLVDLLAHLFEGVSVSAPYGGADINCLAKGTTTAVDEGSAGYSMIAGFRKYIINTSSTRVFSLLNIGVTGTIVNDGSMANLGFVNPQLTAKAAVENRPAVVGIFVRLGEGAALTKEVEFEGLKRALEAAKFARLPMVVHFFEQFTSMPSILKMMRKGDVLTHMCNRDRGILDANGKILPEVREARQRGVLFDSGHSAVLAQPEMER
jgi:dihydroorotase